MEHAKQPTTSVPATTISFFLIALVWIAFDRWTKTIADSHEVGEVFVDNIANLFEFKLIHNTGAAWGIFGDSPIPLGIFSLVVCLFIFLYVFALRRAQGPLGETIALAFVFAGGVGNALDRFMQGYVTDFIHTTFIEFPVFNVADIGVTCGIIVFLLVALLEARKG